jgi:outer membrane receptor protein involved in Fe transport
MVRNDCTGRRTRALLLAGSVFAGFSALGAPAVVMVGALGVAGVAAAQDYTSANLTARVTDPSGAPIAGAQVVLQSSQGIKRQATSAADGSFQIPALPFGSYKAVISAAGFQQTSNDVEVSQAGAAYSFTLSRAEGQPVVGELIVTARKKTDFTKTDTGLVANVQALADKVPIARDINAVVDLAPSATPADATITSASRRNQPLSSISGTSAAESVYYINGLNVTDQRTFLGYANLPFDAIQSIDVKTGGYSPEFGRATGAVVNIVTRSGSNDFHGGASAFWTPSGLAGKSPTSYYVPPTNVAGEYLYNGQAKRDLVDTDVWLSGPIIKDRLFFFALLNPREEKVAFAPASNGPAGTNAVNGIQQTAYAHDPRWFGKLDFNITDKQRLEATVFSDAQTTRYNYYNWSLAGGRGARGLPSASKSGGLDSILKYTGVFTDWFTLSAQVGQVNAQYTDGGPLASTPRVRDRTGVVSPNNPTGAVQYLTGARYATLFNLHDADRRDSFRADADFYGRLYGSHHVRLGLDVEKLKSNDLGAYNGGRRIDILNSPANGDYAIQTVYQTSGNFNADQNAYYLEDSWTISPSLTVQAGLRLDTYDYKTSAGASFIKLDNQFAPRLGFAWDPTGSGADKFYGSFGRYYLPVAENTAIREAAAAPYYQDYFHVSRDGSGNLVLNPDGTPVYNGSSFQHVVFSSSDVPDPRAVAASNIKPMYSEEFIIGFEHRFDAGLLANWRMGLRYTDRHLGQTIEDTELYSTGHNAATPEAGPLFNYCNRTQVNCSNLGNYDGAFTLFNPGSAARVFIDLDGAGAKYITLTKADLAMPKATNHYQALEYTFERPWDGKWSLQGSYALAYGKGNYEGAVKSDIGQTDTSITQDFDLAAYEVGAKGWLPNDHRHTFKVWGAYALLDNLTVGANFLLQSGRHQSCIGYSPNDPKAGSATPSAWWCPMGPGGSMVLTPRGSLLTTPWLTRLDVNLAYQLPLPQSYGQAKFTFDTFNLLNSHTVERYVEQGVIGNTANHPSAFWGKPRTLQTPRAVRFGLRYSF